MPAAGSRQESLGPAANSRRRFEDATALLSDPNPVVTARDASRRQTGVDSGGVDADLGDERSAAQRRPLPLLGLDTAQAAAGRLAGPEQGPAPIASLDGEVVLVNKTGPRFEAAMAYAHLDRLQFADADAALRTAAAALQPAARPGSTWVDIVEQEARRTGLLPPLAE